MLASMAVAKTIAAVLILSGSQNKFPWLALNNKGSQGAKLIYFLQKFQSDVKELYQKLSDQEKLDVEVDELKDVFDTWNEGNPTHNGMRVDDCYIIFKLTKSQDTIPINLLPEAFICKYVVIKKV